MTASLLVWGTAAVAAYTDVKSRRIPNALVLLLLAAGLTTRALDGWQSFGLAVALLVAVFAAGTVLFSLRLIGGGDVKFLAAAAATLGWSDAIPFLLYTILAGGLLGVLIAAARGQLRPMLANLRLMAAPMLAGMRPATQASVVGSMPYAVAIFAGATAVLLGNLFGFILRIPL